MQLFLPDEQATIRFAEDLALALKQGDLVALEGDLGAGKTTLARAFIRALANDDGLDVPSPTFTLLQQYDETRIPVCHADLYRINEAEEVLELGFQEAREEGIILVEWPEKAKGLLNPVSLSLTLYHEKAGRRIDIAGDEKVLARLKRSLLIRDFLSKNDRGEAQRRFFSGDASARCYETIHSRHGNEIVMDAPVMELPESGKQSYAKIAHLAPDMAQFVGIDRMLRDNGFLAPDIRGIDLENGLLVIEDLGREGILDENRTPIESRYIAAGRFLALMHQAQWVLQRQWNDLHITIPPYDEAALEIEVLLLPEWYLPYQRGRGFDVEEKEKFIAAWQPLFARLQKVNKTLVLRDYHSPNILWQETEDDQKRIGLIDFQDGLIGPEAYDLASLAQDARVTIPASLESAIVDAYCTARHHQDKVFDEALFRESYAIMAAQRASKILGIFVRLNERDGKPHYLKHLPRLLDYLDRSFRHPALAELKRCYEALGILKDADK